MATKKKSRMLLLDDDIDLAEVIRDYYIPRGYSVDYYEDPLIPLSKFRKSSETPPYDVVLSDLKMPNFDGLSFVREMKKIHPELPIVLMTAYGGVDTAIEATRSGAYHFVLKPINFQILSVTLETAVEHRRAKTEISSLRQALDAKRTGGPIARSPKMLAVFDLARRVSRSTANVLIQGESGTGKEVVAKMIHESGPRAEGPFVAINCSAIPETLMESELFGYAKGAFTGAAEKKPGLFEDADGGTLFLDEIGDLSLPLQAKLLRVLQDRKIKRLGENSHRKIDVRIIAATHKNLETEVRAKHFREDLFFRLNVIPIRIPALRERTEDILPLAEHFLRRFALENGMSMKGMSKDGAEKLLRLRWDGNVRELENAMERAVVLANGDAIGADEICTSQFSTADSDSDTQSGGGIAEAPRASARDVSRNVEPRVSESPMEAQTSRESYGANSVQVPKELAEIVARLHRAEIMGVKEGIPSLEDCELAYIAHVFRRTEGVKERAASILGIDRKTLYKKLRKLDERAALIVSNPESGQSAEVDPSLLSKRVVKEAPRIAMTPAS